MKSKKITVKTHQDFLNYIKEIYNKKENVLHRLDLAKNYFSVTKIDIDTEKQLSVEYYTYDCGNIKTFLETLLENKTSINVYSMASNSYGFLMNPAIFDLLLTVEDLKSKHIAYNRKFELKTKSKVRTIVAPHDDIKGALQDINRILQSTYDDRNKSFQVAYKKGQSIKTNTEPHKNNKYIFKIDLHNFFPSCKKEYVEKYVKFLFKNTQNAGFVKKKFLDCVLDNDALFIGSPISGTLANTIISKPVSFLKNICNKLNITFTVYADDMTFSSERFIPKKMILDLFNIAFTQYDMDKDFTLTESKCHGLIGAKRAVTGVAINDKNQLTCHRYIYNGIRQTLHQMSYGDLSHYNHGKLSGQIAFMYMLDESGKLKTLLNKYEPVVKQYKLFNMDKLN